MERLREQKTVVIDCFPESVAAYRQDFAIVAIDVIRATTTAVTGVAAGRSCFPAPTLESALSLAATLPDPLLIGELGGAMPDGFHMTNSPADLAERNDHHRPMVLLSSSGTRLVCNAAAASDVYLACLRNMRAQVDHLANHHSAVAVIGAGSRGEFREEDQLCCAWIADSLLEVGYEPLDARTSAIIERWRGAPIDAIADGASAAYLRRTDQRRDLEFILTHIDDIDGVYRFERGQVAALTAASSLSRQPEGAAVP